MSVELDGMGVSQMPNVDGLGIYIPGNRENIPGDMVFYASLSPGSCVESDNKAETGQSLVLGNSEIEYELEFTTYKGIPCVYSPEATFESQYSGMFHLFSASALTGAITVSSAGSALSFWFYNTSDDHNRGLIATFHQGRVTCVLDEGDDCSLGFSFYWNQEGDRRLKLTDHRYINEWTHVLINFVDGYAWIYINGVPKGSISLLNASTGLPNDISFCGSWNGNASDGAHFEGYASSYRLYSHSLTKGQINALVHEFTPTA